MHFQLTDMESHPTEGLTFDDCIALNGEDSLAFDIRWNGGVFADVFQRIVRLEVRMRHARRFAIRGHFHFIDAQDRSLIQDGQPIAVE